MVEETGSQQGVAEGWLLMLRYVLSLRYGFDEPRHVGDAMSSYTFVQDWALRLRNPFAGLHWFSRCSDDAPLLVSRHYPHLLCWSWSITWRPHGRLWAYFMRHNCGGNAWIGSLCFDWQNYRIRRTDPRRPE